MRAHPTRPRLTYLFLIASLPTVLVGQTSRTQRPPTFEGAVEAIQVNVSVTDNRNRYVTGLSERDFAIFEDGIRQELSLFTNDNLPISLSILIDCSASMYQKLPFAQTAGIRFIKTLRAQDLAQVAQFNGRITLLQDFTADQKALEAAIRGTRASGSTVLNNALYVGLKELTAQTRGPELRRRAIVLLSDGEDTASLVSEDQVLDLARHAEIALYAVSLRPDRPQDRDRIQFSQATYFLSRLARETGGQVLFPNSLSELDVVYDRVAEELRTQYTLGYVSANQRRDGKWRRIVVRTPSRDDILVRHKIGYFGPRGSPG